MEIKKHNKKNIPGGIRTHNPLIRSQMPYPLGHGDNCDDDAFLSYKYYSEIFIYFFSKTLFFFCVRIKVNDTKKSHRTDSNHRPRDYR